MVITLVLLCLFQTVVLAQVQGCVINGNNKIIYTQKIDGLLTSLINALLGGSPLYAETTFQSQSNCSYVLQSGGTSCKVCPSGLQYNFLGAISGCSGSMASGYEGYYIVECNLDSLSYLLLPVCCYIGFRKIKRQA